MERACCCSTAGWGGCGRPYGWAWLLKLAHLDGLNLSRAWCWRALAGALPAADPRRARMEAAATAHLDAALGTVAGDYMGEHWLASFAVLALDDETTPRRC